jgi:SAM-dependent methyltransferase
VEGFDASTYGERFADVYDEWYADVSDVAATVATVEELAGGGPVLELGVGTGRLAVPLAERGLAVHGIDASPAMLDRLATKAAAAGVTVSAHEGDFADVAVEVDGGFAVVLVAFNTLFNLADAGAQRRCLANAARRLRPDGCLAIEAFVAGVPGPDFAPEGGAVTPRVVEADRVVLQVSMHDVATQTVRGSLVTITEAGIRLRPWFLRWTTPDQLDGMAAAAGLDRAARWAGWDRQPFDDECPRHVTVYRPTGR